MTIEIKQSSTTYPLVFLMVDSTDHVTGKTGLSPTVTLSKAGGSFGAASGAVTEIANGWYKVAGNATDNNTLGPLILHATGTAADPTDVVFNVTARLADDLAYPTVSGRSLDVSAGGEAGIDWANIGSPTTAVNLSATNIDVDQVVASVSGAVGSVTGAVGSVTGLTAATVHADLDDIQSRLPAALVSGRMDSSVGAMASGVLTATAIAADAITDAKVASDVTIASVTGAVGSVTGSVGSVTGNVGGSVASIATGGISEASFATTAGSFSPLGIIDQGTAQSATGTTLVLRAAAAFADDELIGALILITGGSTGVGQVRKITDYVSTTDTATVDTWTTTPTGTITYKVLASPPIATTLPAVNVTHAAGTAWNSGAISASTLAADTITDAKVASDVTIASVTGAVGSVTGNVGGNVTGSVGSIATGGIAATSFAAGAIDAAAIATDAIGALELAAGAASEIATAVRTELTTELGRIDVAVSTRASQASVDTIDGIVDSILVDTAEIGVAGAGLTALASAANLATVDTVVDAIKVTTDKIDDTIELTSDGYIFTANALQQAPTGGSAPTAAAIADAVWEEAIADHSGTAGSTAEALAAAGSAGDPWITALPGAYTAGQAGYIVGTNLNATVSSRATQTSVDDIPTNAELATALGTADDAVLTAIGDLPTNAELATALGTADDAVLAAIADLPTNAELADLVWDEVIDGATTARESVRLSNAVLGGKASGLATTTVVYRDLADTKDRIQATVDSDGNRSAITRDLT